MLYLRNSIIALLYALQAGLVLVKWNNDNTTSGKAVRFVLEYSFYDYESLLSKSGVDSFRILSIKIWWFQFIRLQIK